MVKVYNYLCNYSSNIIKKRYCWITFIQILLINTSKLLLVDIIYYIRGTDPQFVPILFSSDLVPYCS
jgi:hypothetical protein